MFNVLIEQFETEKEICSPELIVSGIPWQIKIHKRGTTKNNFVLDLALKCSNVKTNENQRWSCKAFAIFKIHSIQTNEALVVKKLPKKEFSEGFLQNTLAEFISWNDLSNPDKTFIDQGKICFDVEIFADPVKAFKPVEIECFCSTFKITIENAGKMTTTLKTEKTFIRELKWWIQLEKENDYIGIFLNCDHENIPRNWYYKVNAKFKMVTDNDGMVLKENKYEKDFRAGLHSWGFSKFVTCDEYSKAADGAYIEAEIKVDAAKPMWSYEDGIQSLVCASISKCPICFESFSSRRISSTLHF